MPKGYVKFDEKTLTLNITLPDGNKFSYRDIIKDNPEDFYFVKTISKFAPYTMTVNRGIEPSYSLFKAVEYIVKNKIPGDFVECGVWRGGSIILIALALKYFGDTERKIFLYDTFTGMTEPDELDIDWDGKNLKKKWNMDSLEKAKELTDSENPQWGIKNPLWGYGGSIEDVRNNIYEKTDYPRENFIFVKGPVEQTIPNTISEKIALLRLDTDWYASTYHELVHLYPILSSGGVLIIDDYGWCKGAREATDKYLKDNKINLYLNRIDESVRLAIKR